MVSPPSRLSVRGLSGILMRKVHQPQKNVVKASLSDLPEEILVIIFRYLDPIFLIRTIALVCKRFTTILLDEDLWKIFFFRQLRNDNKLCNVQIPILEAYGLNNEGWHFEPSIQWRDLTIRLEKTNNRWNNVDNLSKFHSSTETVDTIHILKNTGICVTGSREKCIDLWDVNSSPIIKCSVVEAHRGWVSCLESFESDHFISGAWDSTISYWNIGQSGCRPVWKFLCDRGVMAVAGRRGMIVAGTFSPSFTLIDPRISENQRSIQYVVHEKPLINLKLCDNYVISIGRDQKLCCFDLRKLALIAKMNVFKTPGVPRSLAVRNGIAYVGDTKGNVHLFDANDDFKKFHQIAVAERQYQVSSICPNLCSLIAGCTDRTFKVILLSKPHTEIKSVACDHEITSMSYQNEILAVAKTNGAVDVFKPG